MAVFSCLASAVRGWRLLVTAFALGMCTLAAAQPAAIPNSADAAPAPIAAGASGVATASESDPASGSVISHEQNTALGAPKQGLEYVNGNSSLWDGFNLGGYSSAGINIHPDGNADASVNELSLFLRWDGSGRWRFFTEIEIERPLSIGNDGKISSTNAFLDIERFYLDYNLSEQVNLRAGRFLTPAGRWNVIHAAPLQWTTSRPLVTSRMFPESINGIMLYGAMPVQNRAFEYTVYIDTLQQDSHDKLAISYQDARGLRLAMTGKLNVGISLLDVTEKLLGGQRYQMAGADFMIRHEGYEASGEVLQRYTTDGSDGGNGAYLQAVAPLGNQWFAVGRVESFKRPAEGSSERWVIGTAWRKTTKQVLKLEYVGGDEERAESPKGLLASFAILF